MAKIDCGFICIKVGIFIPTVKQINVVPVTILQLVKLWQFVLAVIVILELNLVV